MDPKENKKNLKENVGRLKILGQVLNLTFCV